MSIGLDIWVEVNNNPDNTQQVYEDNDGRCYLPSYRSNIRHYFNKTKEELKVGEIFHIYFMDGKKYIKIVENKHWENKQMIQEHKGLPVSGYLPQTDEKVAMVNTNKELEEQLLRRIEWFEKENTKAYTEFLKTLPEHNDVNKELPTFTPFYDPQMLVDAKMQLRQSMMWLNRAIFQPARVKLPEDDLIPNQETINAMNDARNGVGMTRVNSVQELMDDLNADDSDDVDDHNYS